MWRNEIKLLRKYLQYLLSGIREKTLYERRYEMLKILSKSSWNDEMEWDFIFWDLEAIEEEDTRKMRKKWIHA